MQKWLTLMILQEKICLQIPDHAQRILIIRCFGYRKTNALLNPISHQPDIDKIYLYAMDSYEAKCQLLIKKLEIVGA